MKQFRTLCLQVISANNKCIYNVKMVRHLRKEWEQRQFNIQGAN